MAAARVMASAMSGEVVNTSSAFGTKRANEAGLLMSVVRKCPSEVKPARLTNNGVIIARTYVARCTLPIKPLLARDAGGDCVAVAPHQFKFLKDFRNYFDAQ